MDINFEYYKIFYYVAKYENITKAAMALGSSQPNVTRVMKLLESQLGCRLFIREARGIRLTEEGELLYSHVEVAYRHLMNAQEEICRPDSLTGGAVELGTTETALHLFLLDALHAFRQKYPEVRIKIHNHTTPETIRQLTGGRVDFAVITMPYELPVTVSGFPVLDFEEVLVGGVQYKELCKTSLRLKDIRKYPWIGLGRGSATYALYKEFFIQHGVDFEPDMEVETSDLMLPLIENNFGIGFVPEKIAAPLFEEGKLVRIPIDCDIPRRSIQIVSDHGRGKNFAADTLYKYLRDFLQGSVLHKESQDKFGKIKME
ncbi:MAG: LysR family transcriptional regulator [Lachnospiraceae bacterium]|nr:LysR family transcriptional regulator [Lachnospiraceae bacterium]